MTAPVRPNTEDTGIDTAPGESHTGAPPLIVSTCPAAPFTSPTIFPVLWSQLLNVNRSPKSPVVLLYEIPPPAESDVSQILLLNVVQSVPVRRPVDVADAFQIAMVTFGPTVEFAPPEMVMAELVVVKLPNVRADCLELNVVQSVPERAPVVVAFARARASPVPTRESPLAGAIIERAPCLLLNVVQSVPVSAQVVVADEFQIENTPVVLL